MENIVELYANQTEKVKSYIGKYDKVYIYGAGEYGRKMIHILRKFRCEIEGIVVSDKNGNPERVLGNKVYALDEIACDNDKTVFVLGVSDRYIQEIVSTLKECGHCNIVKMEGVPCMWQINREFPKLEITAQMGCSVQCKYCPQSLLYANYYKEDKNRAKRISLEDFKTCVDNMPKETIISFAGFVEPFHHPDAIEMMKYAYKKGNKLELYTTFVGVTMEMLSELKEIAFQEVVLHTPDRDNFANIPMTEEYIKVMDEVLSWKKSDGSPFIDSANCQSEPSDAFLELAGNRIEVKSCLVDRAGNLDDDSLKRSVYKTGKITCNRSKALNHWVLLPDGSVVMCCMDFGLKHTFGNLIQENYEEIIKGKVYNEALKQLETECGGEEMLCRSCTSSSWVK